MLWPLVIIFWVVFISGSYVSMKYKQSRNKKLFFKGGIYKPFIWSLAITIIAPILFNLFFPNEPVDLNFLKLHSDIVNDIEPLKAEGSLIKHYTLRALSIFTEMHLLGLISATLVFGIWYFYVRSLDFFDKEKIKFTIIIVLAGALITFFTFPLSDAIHGLLGISFSENTFYNLFVYCFLGIGVIEEFIKLIPVLFILYFTNEIDEPIDFIYYACLSALGFAFIENLIYFRELSGSIVIARAITSAVGHMVDSSIVIYGIILVFFNKPGSKFLTVLKYFLLGSFVHALYDYFIFEGLILFFIASFIFFIQAWVIIINNAINNSKYFDYSISFKHDLVKFKIAEYLIYLLVFNYFINGLLVGKVEANIQYVVSLSYGSLLIIFYVSSISSFDLVKGYWRPVKFQFSRPNEEAFPGVRGVSTFRSFFTDNIITPLNHVGKKIKLHCPRFNHDLLEIFRIGEGKIVDRLRLVYRKGKRSVEDTNWFVVALKTPLEVNDDYENKIILIKIKDTFASFVHDEHIKCWLKLVPKGISPKKEKDISKYEDLGYIMINGEDYEYEID